MMRKSKGRYIHPEIAHLCVPVGIWRHSHNTLYAGWRVRIPGGKGKDLVFLDATIGGVKNSLQVAIDYLARHDSNLAISRRPTVEVTDDQIALIYRIPDQIEAGPTTYPGISVTIYTNSRGKEAYRFGVSVPRGTQSASQQPHGSKSVYIGTTNTWRGRWTECVTRAIEIRIGQLAKIKSDIAYRP